ncbi:pyridoxal-phosphate-dependent aminotransferase family protein [Desulfobaculum bizertense]|uniref:Aspartate aminotransferase n=1 Tax=Desulfobaculum bizertense DSM 18034 TaxID=1121442 RepID=A0A1T4X135_9BACT|nr:alanine--glyoxylate aminotransferase family protein [Desulfobaculum bizertense]UIJ37185.1 alanine--glyoxylate aminotransferase family protein [Desulfobaculum bizertense]SKA83219.1 aspartate aminotransferase [Desulfobaculum bizertense DSM 18034]
MDKMRLLTPGPTPLPEEVRLTLAMDMVHHRKPGFTALLGEIQKDLQWLFETSQPVISLASSGSGAMTAAVTNLFKKGDQVLIIEGGKFGERWGNIASTYGIDTGIISVPWGKPITIGHIETALRQYPKVKGILVQASETSTGVLHPIKEIAEYLREKDILLVVDGISAVGISPLPMDKWGIDCLLTGSQKGLMLPPGLSFISLSERAWKRVEENRPREFYFNLLGERDKILKNSQTLFTPPINLLMGLHTCLGLFRQQGMENVFRRQWALTQMVRTAATAMGLTLLAEDHYTWGLTSIKLPEGVDGQAVLSCCAERYGIILAGGQDSLKGRIVRFGHMGHVDYGDVLAGIMALMHSIAACDGEVKTDNVLEQAMAAYEKASDEGYPEDFA